MQEEQVRTGIIYCATNKVNGKQYVGQTRVKFKYRQRLHHYEAFKVKSDTAFHRALRKYGEDCFDWQEIVECDVNYLNVCEKHFIDKMETLGVNGYNSTSGGEKDFFVSEETRNKLRLANIGKKHTEEQTRKQRESILKTISDMLYHPNLGIKHSKEFCDKIRERMTGEKNINYGAKCITEEMRRKCSERGKELVGEKNPFFGKKHTKESIENGRITQFKFGLLPTNKSGFKGVSWHSHNKKWQVIVNRKRIGYFKDKIEAAKAWDKAAVDMLGAENVTTNKDLGLYNE